METSPTEAAGSGPDIGLERPPMDGPVAPDREASRRSAGYGLGGVLSVVWGAKRLWMSLIALGCGLYGQKLLIEYQGSEQAVNAPAIRWYTASIALLIVAWWGTYKNSSELRVESQGSQLATRNSQLALVLAFAALGLNLLSVSLLRADYYSALGGFGWLASLLLFASAFLKHRSEPGSNPDVRAEDVEVRTDFRVPRGVEVAVFLGIFALALGLRLYRLGDLTAGMNVDEGGFGVYALRILGGETVSPFATWWMNQENFSWWAIALTMKVFGTDLFGLRMFSVLAGMLVLVPFYGLARIWFGIRFAVIATFLLAVMEASVHTSRLALNNMMTPFCLVAGFYFLFRGLRAGRTLDFVLAGYAQMLGLYFYYAGRLTPILLVAVLGYLFVLTPLARMPGVYRELSKRAPGLGRLELLRRAAGARARAGLYYRRQILVFVVASFCFASPYLAYFLDHQELMAGHIGEKLIFNSADGLAARYQLTHDPLYIGLRVPTLDDVYPVLPVVFERTTAAIKLSDDGFWALVLWKQATTVLGMFTNRGDPSGFYPFTEGEPVVKPIESVLLVLGLAWALWRWRDARMAVLSMWFWSTVLAGGVLTVDAPYFERLPGVIPTLAILVAIPLNKLAAEFIDVVGSFGKVRSRARPSSRGARLCAHAVLLSLLVYLGAQNSYHYLIQYMGDMGGGLNAPYDGSAYFVRQMNRKVTSEGRPKPMYYNFGAFQIEWDHNANAFINYGTYGVDVRNASNELPVTNNGDRDAVFIVQDVNSHYLPLIKSYYPGGEGSNFDYRPPGRPYPFFAAIYYRVKKEQIDARRTSRATYTSARGEVVNREEPGLGTTIAPPDNLAYPVRATWHVGLAAPAYARYSFQVAGTGEAGLTIDGMAVIATSTTPRAGADAILARGLHEVTLTGTLKSSSDVVRLTWSAGGSAPAGIERKYLWSGPGRGLAGEVYPLSADSSDGPLGDPPSGTQALQRRVEGFFGFRHSPDVLATGGPLLASWTGDLMVAEPGSYGFEVFSNGPSQALIDDRIIVSNSQAAGDGSTAQGIADLAEGTHRFKVRYNWSSGTGYLELFWTLPDGRRMLIGPEAFRTEGGAWPPGSVAEPPQYSLPLTDDVRPLGSGNE